MTRASSPIRNSAGQTRLPTFSNVRVEVALAAEPVAGVQLRDGDVQVRQAVGVEAALDVALEHRGAHPAQALAAEGPLQEGRRAGAGGAHDVHDRHARAVEVLAVGAGDRVVGVQRVLDDPDLDAVHAYICLIFM
jgi:hypothetical protein